METEIPQENENEDRTNYESEWDNRILCSDGNCIGVIGADGRCKECGRKYGGPLPEISVVEQEDPVGGEDEEMPAAPDESDTNTVEESPVNEDWGNRVLCRDGNCIGVIGPDGKCKECGKPYE